MKIDIRKYLQLIPDVQDPPDRSVWMTYDAQADTLYVNFRKPSQATDSELTDDDVINRFDGQEVVGLTILHAAQR
jgi:uncharacterized protein YuzE